MASGLQCTGMEAASIKLAVPTWALVLFSNVATLSCSAAPAQIEPAGLK